MKISAVMSVPRFGCHHVVDSLESATSKLGITLRRFYGPYWHQEMQDAFVHMVREGAEMILTFDHDSMVTATQIELLIHHARDDDVHALAALQVSRACEAPLLSHENVRTVDGCNLVLTDTAHFGCTAIKTAQLKEVALPWFWGIPDKSGCWRVQTPQPLGIHPSLRAAHDWHPQGTDPDIWFWRQWKHANNSLYIDWDVRIGHMEEMVSYYDAKGVIQRCYPDEWKRIAETD